MYKLYVVGTVPCWKSYNNVCDSIMINIVCNVNSVHC